MRYIIDTANDEQIQEALDMGACGVTANPSMYLKNQQNFYEFVKKYAALQLPFFSAEVMEGAAGRNESTGTASFRNQPGNHHKTELFQKRTYSL